MSSSSSNLMRTQAGFGVKEHGRLQTDVRRSEVLGAADGDGIRVRGGYTVRSDVRGSDGAGRRKARVGANRRDIST